MVHEIEDLSGVVAKKNIQDGYCFITNRNLNPPFQRVPQDNQPMKEFSRLPSCFAHYTSLTHEHWVAIEEGSFVKYRAEVVIRPNPGAVKLRATWVWIEENDEYKDYYDGEETSDDQEESPEPPWKKPRYNWKKRYNV